MNETCTKAVVCVRESWKLTQCDQKKIAKCL